MNAIRYNIKLITPIIMLLAWAFLKIVTNKNFADLYKKAGKSPSLDDRFRMSVIAAKTIYEKGGNISSVKYILTTFKICMLCAKATALARFLYSIQFDDGTNAFSDSELDEGIFFAFSVLFIIIGSLIFNILFYRFFRGRIFQRNEIKYMIKDLVYLLFISILLIASSIMSVYLMPNDVSLLTFILPGASILWWFFISDIIANKILLIPATILIMISVFSFLFPFIVYWMTFIALSCKQIYKITGRISLFMCDDSSIYSKSIVMLLNFIQCAYWAKFYISVFIKQ